MAAPEAMPARPRWSWALRARGGRLAAAWLLPVLMWVAATLYLGGDLGKNTDDYAINLRDPVSGQIPEHFNPWASFPYFWRPLHNLMCFGVGTLWPDGFRGIHIAVALFHGLACVGLWLFLRQFTRTALAPAAAALVFLTLPFNGEVAMWFCTTSTAIGTAGFFAAALLATRYVRFEREGVGSPLAIFRLVLMGVCIFGLIFAVACFYEQSAAPAAVLPAICLAAAPRTQRWSMRLRRAALVTAAAGLACVLYVVLFQATAPAYVRGGPGSLVTMGDAAKRLSELQRSIASNLFGEKAHHIIGGSLAAGWQTVRRPAGVLWLALLLGPAMMWVTWSARRGMARGGRVQEPDGGAMQDRISASPIALFAIGLLMFLAAWVPVYIVARQNVEVRMLYVPLLGAAAMFAAVLDALGLLVGARFARLGASCRAVTAIAVLVVAVVGTVGMIGFQTLFHQRWRLDQQEVAQLKALFPNPSPGTVFVPFHTGDAPTRTGFSLFDRGRPGVFETTWSAESEVHWAYRRVDIGATCYNPWAPLPLDAPTEEGVHWKTRISVKPETEPGQGVRVRWDEIVPFVTDAEGRVKLIRRIDVEAADHRDLEIRPPLVQRLIERGVKMPTATFRMTESTAGADNLVPVTGWRFGDGKPAEFAPVKPWDVLHEGTWLAPDAGPRKRMAVTLPPNAHPRRFLMRVSIAAYDLDPARNPVAKLEELRVCRAGAIDEPLATVHLDPREVRAARKWIPVTVNLPPSADPDGDRIIVLVRATDDPPVRTDPKDRSPIPADARVVPLGVWVTPGYLQDVEPAGR